MDLRLLSEPLTREQKLEVVTVAEVKRDLRIRHARDDEMIGDDIEVAYDYLAGPEGWLNGCSLLEEDWELYLPSGVGPLFEIPARPLVGATLTAFDYLVDDAYVAIDPDRYFVTDVRGSFAQVSAVAGRPWPYVGAWHARAYRLRFTSGFGTTKTSIPSPIRKGIRLLAGHYNKAREASSDEAKAPGQEIIYGLRSLCGRYRISPDHS